MVLQAFSNPKAFCPLSRSSSYFPPKFPSRGSSLLPFFVGASNRTAPIRCVSSSSPQLEVRPIINFPADIWGNRLDFFSFNASELELYNDDNDDDDDEHVQVMKKEVEGMLMSPTSDDPVDRIKLIDLLSRLGVSYHFQAEIDEQLHEIFHSQPRLLENQGYDLYTVALVFRVLRQHGHKMSCGVFNKFKDENNGMFKESLAKDPKGLLSLYEAAHLSTYSEDILEEALSFTVAHLQPFAFAHSGSPFATHILNSLKHPLHKGMPRVKAREFISFYQQHHDINEPRNEILLEFAKLDFNRIQLLHRREIQCILRWWEKLDLRSKLPYARDRIMEMYFWSACEYYEPQYSYAREVYTKILYLLTYLDDTYDAYGTFEELQMFTNALESWNQGVLDQLPADYLKHLCKAYMDLFDEIDTQATNEGRRFAVSITRDMVVELAKAQLVECQWIKEGHLPSFDESFEKVGRITSGVDVTTAISLVGMGKLAGSGAYKWLLSGPDIVTATRIISRFSDDVASYKRDEESGYFTSPFCSYKREHDMEDKEAVEEFRSRIANAWKTVNEALMTRPLDVPTEILVRVLNIARTVEVNYRHGDALTYVKHVENYIKALFIDPIPF